MAAVYSYRPIDPDPKSSPKPLSSQTSKLSPPAPPMHDTRLRLLGAVNSMPPFPVTLSQLLGLLNDDSCTSTEVAAMIERDSVLSGGVLRCVNSAYYGVPGRVSSIRHAVTLLGFATVRNLGLAFSMRRMMQSAQPAGKTYAAYSRHALASALMTQFLAHLTRSPEIEAAFAAGLFHDVGKLLVLTTTPDLIPRIIEQWEAGGAYSEAESDVLGVTHAELSGAVVNAWRLPEEIDLAVRCHHNPASSTEPHSPLPGSPPGLAWLVQAANAAVKHAGFEAVSSPQRPPDDPVELFKGLGLGEQLPDILAQFQTQFQEIQAAFG